jgi:hypothetical protein
MKTILGLLFSALMLVSCMETETATTPPPTPAAPAAVGMPASFATGAIVPGAPVPPAVFQDISRGTELKCEYTGPTTALCTCNQEPDAQNEQACLNVLRANCGRVTNGEALCPVDPA